ARDVLVAKVLAAAGSRVRRPRATAGATAMPTARPPTGRRLASPCVVIGISTGGPQTLTRVLPELVPPLPPVLVVQHMPATFTRVFARRLDQRCKVPVREADDGQRVEPDQILIAPGGRHLALSGRPPIVRVALSDDP